ncbi:MAG: polyprenyl synthetase family protein, partial [Bacillota bacterium]
DDDDYRRGNPANHKVYGSGIAILAGDALLTYAFKIISQLEYSANKLINIINLISQAAGLNGMVAGQVLDLEGENKDLSLEELRKIHKNKTGGLFQASILSGAYCGDPEPEEIKSLNQFAGNLGLLFQIVDDILDIVGVEEKLGKTIGKDEEQNKSTYPGILGLEQSRKKAERAAEKALISLQPFGERACELKQLTEFVLKRQY